MKLDLITVGLVLVVAVLGLFAYNEYVVAKPAEIWLLGYDQIGADAQVTVVVKNNLATPQDVFVEVGIIPDSVCGEWFGMQMSIIGERPTQCCAGQSNINGKTVTLLPMETTTVELLVHKPYSGIEDKCGSTNYYDSGGQYQLYGVASNHCNWINGVKQQGYVNYDYFYGDFN